jgi:transposase
MTKSDRQNRKGGGNNKGRTETFRKQIATSVIREKLTLREASIRFDIPNQTISEWVQRFYDEIEQINVIEPMNHPSDLPVVPDAKLAEYESKLNLAQLKITALETMIEVAEKKYKIDITKNVGTKQ